MLRDITTAVPGSYFIETENSMFMIIFEVFIWATEIIAVKVIKKRTEWRNLRQS